MRHRKVVAERKAKEDAVDAAFARYLADELSNSEEQEKKKDQARREKGIEMNGFLTASDIKYAFLTFLSLSAIRYGNELRETMRKNRT